MLSKHATLLIRDTSCKVLRKISDELNRLRAEGSAGEELLTASTARECLSFPMLYDSL